MTKTSSLVRRAGKRLPRSQRGIALVTALLLLALLTGMTVAMFFATNSDMLTNGYYRNFRGSFYAADSGLAVVRQDLANRMLKKIDSGIAMGNPAYADPVTTASDVVKDLKTAWANSSKATALAGGAASNSLPEYFWIDPSSLELTYDSSPANSYTTTAKDSTGKEKVTSYTYRFKYHMVAVGKTAGSQQNRIEESGGLTMYVPVAMQPPPYFSGYGMYIEKDNVCDGSTLVGGKITGQVFTNGCWNFGTTSVGYTFTDPVGCAGKQVGYQFSKTCDKSTKESDGSIQPKFNGGLYLGQDPVEVPSNDFNQKRAVIDKKGAPVLDGSGKPVDLSKDDYNNSLATVDNKVPCRNSSNDTQTAGVYLPYTDYKVPDPTNKPNAATGTFTGGGIYVSGDADVTVSIPKDAKGNLVSTQQQYNIKQGGTTTTVTVDYAAGTTTVFDGTHTLNLTGVPRQADPTTGKDMGPATMLYVNGNITGLRGGGEAVGSIQDGNALTITSSGNIDIEGDLRYKTEVVSLTGSSAGDMIPDPKNPKAYLNTGAYFGIFSSGGNINLDNKQSSGDLQIDASIAALNSKGTGTLINTGKPIDTLTIVGGRIQNIISNIGSSTRNVYFDRRYANGAAPPWFAATSIPPGTPPSGAPIATFDRQMWVNQTSY